MSEPHTRLFPNAQFLNISGGTFNEITGNTRHYHVQGDYHHHHTESGLNALSQAVSHGAIHDSSERFPPAKCHPDTRREVLKLIEEWVADPEPSSFVFWLYGPAGSGKTAILQSIAEMCFGLNGWLGGSFFFSRGKLGREQGHFLFMTIAYQLALNVPGLREHVNRIMCIQPALHTKSMEVQLRSLIIDALAQLESRPQHTPVVIIDGLDECESHGTQQAILALISEAVGTHKVPLRFLIGSRPEAHIRESFDKTSLYTITRRVVLDESFAPNRDIKVFLQDGFSKIFEGNSRLLSHVEATWPGEGVIDLLVQKSSGQFIYAATVLKFIGAEFFHPMKQLEIVLEPTPRRSTAFSDLDHLYTQILSVYPNPEAVIHVLGVLLVLHCPQRPAVIEDILGMDEGEAKLVLRGLHSLLSFPDDNDDVKRTVDEADVKGHGGGIRLLHASFRDYLIDKGRSGPFFIDTSEADARLTVAGYSLITKWILNLERDDSTRLPHLKTWGYLKWHLAPHFSKCPDNIQCDVVQGLEVNAHNFWTRSRGQRAEVLFSALHSLMTVLVHMMFAKWNWYEGHRHYSDVAFDRTLDHIVGGYLKTSEEDPHLAENPRCSRVFYNYRTILDECYHAAFSASSGMDDLIKSLPGILVQRVGMPLQGIADVFAVDPHLAKNLLDRNLQFISIRHEPAPDHFVLNQLVSEYLEDASRCGMHYHDPLPYNIAICRRYLSVLFNCHWSELANSSECFRGYVFDNFPEHLCAVNVELSEEMLEDHPVMGLINDLETTVYFSLETWSAPYASLIRIWFGILQILRWVRNQVEMHQTPSIKRQ
ncbi:hypothetical protein B0H34DRAFT_156525 [Crassisporium funariophilum]|nr:hypothetical protein B0H34DRAFT_156525 [Crassisporium funariophilum]